MEITTQIGTFLGIFITGVISILNLKEIKKNRLADTIVNDYINQLRDYTTIMGELIGNINAFISTYNPNNKDIEKFYDLKKELEKNKAKLLLNVTNKASKIYYYSIEKNLEDLSNIMQILISVKIKNDSMDMSDINFMKEKSKYNPYQLKIMYNRQLINQLENSVPIYNHLFKSNYSLLYWIEDKCYDSSYNLDDYAKDLQNYEEKDLKEFNTIYEHNLKTYKIIKEAFKNYERDHLEFLQIHLDMLNSSALVYINIEGLRINELTDKSAISNYDDLFLNELNNRFESNKEMEIKKLESKLLDKVNTTDITINKIIDKEIENEINKDVTEEKKSEIKQNYKKINDNKKLILNSNNSEKVLDYFDKHYEYLKNKRI